MCYKRLSFVLQCYYIFYYFKFYAKKFMPKKLTPRDKDYSKWYNEIVINADLAENSSVRGCMVIKPYGYSIWEKMQHELDKMFKKTGHQNAYFPLFVPKSLFEAEEKMQKDLLRNVLL